MLSINKKLILTHFFLASLAAGAASAQENGATTIADSAPARRVNFGYSQNPKTKSKTPKSDGAARAAQTAKIASVSPNENGAPTNAAPYNELQSRTVAKKTLEIARRANGANPAAPPTEIYKVGVGDVLFISLKDAPARASTYYTVLGDGSLDYPLAGEMIPVAGLTTDEIEDALREKIRLYENPQISVKVRENASHAVSVLGLVEKAGEKYLQREAVPLYVIKAEAIVQARADSVSIKRLNAQVETLDLKDAKTDDALVFPGDVLEFKASNDSTAAAAATNFAAPQFYYIGGEIASAGQKDFHQGLTLTQAILACGGAKKAGAKKAVIRRKNEQGLLSPIEFDLNAIRDGKQPDPILQAGDTIEIVRY